MSLIVKGHGVSGKILLALIFAFSALPSSSCFAAAYYFQPGSMAGGNGSYETPFICTSDPESFDAPLRSIPPLSSIHLASGSYYTKGVYNGDSGYGGSIGWRMKSGWALEGAGTTATKIVLVDKGSTNGSIYGNTVISTFTDSAARTNAFLTVKNLTLDCGASSLFSSGTQMYSQGVTLRGDNGARVEGVCVTNFVNSTSGNTEAFIVEVGTPNATAGTAYSTSASYSILSCVVNSTFNYSGSEQKISAATLNFGNYTSGTGLVSNCSIEFQYWKKGQFALNAHRTADWGDSYFTYNEIWNAERGFNNDVAPAEGVTYNLRIYYNDIYVPSKSNGLHLLSSLYGVAYGNDIYIYEGTTSGDAAAGISLNTPTNGESGAVGWLIAANNIYKSYSGYASQSRGVWIDSAYSSWGSTWTAFEDNRISNGIDNTTCQCSYFDYASNREFDGTTVPNGFSD